MSGYDAEAVDLAASVRSGEASAEQLVKEAISRSKTIGRELNCFTEIFADAALSDAARIDARIRAGEPVGPLAGVPFAVKNLFDVAGAVTLAGSKIDRDRPAASRDATVIFRLREAGAILLGALGMAEYAYGFTSENTHYGPVLNPYDKERTAGGSSSGSGAAVASACVPAALGTDTNGSVRVPASLCGTFGLKPTYGRVSRAGVTPFTPSLDHVGFLTRSARDTALLYDVTHGHDPADPVSSGAPAQPTLVSIDQGIETLRMARARGYFEEEATADALDAVDNVARALQVSAEADIPEAKTARNAAMIVTAVEGSALHMSDLRSRPADFDPMTRDRFIAGALLAGEAYVRAQTFRTAFQELMRRIFSQYDLLVAPATPMVAPKIGQVEIDIGGRNFPSRMHLGRFTQPISFVGLPVVVVPLRARTGLPIGVQLIGAPYSEAVLLRAARYLERAGVTRTATG